MKLILRNASLQKKKLWIRYNLSFFSRTHLSSFGSFTNPTQHRAVAHAVTLMLLTDEGPRAIHMAFFGGQIGTWGKFFSQHFGFPLPVDSRKTLIHHWGRHNGPTWRYKYQGAQSFPAARIKEKHEKRLGNWYNTGSFRGMMTLCIQMLSVCSQSLSQCKY